MRRRDLAVEGEEDDVDPEERVRFTEQEALANLRTVLELCAAGEVRCSDKTKRPSAATIRTITAHLAQGDFYDDEPIAAFAWPLLLQAGGLAALDGTRLRLTPKGRAALGKPPAEVIRGLWQRWLTHAVIDEFSRVEQIKGQRVPNVLTAAKPRRQSVAKALATCPQDKWVDVDTLFTTMRRGNMSPTIARNDRALWRLYLVDPEYGSLGYDGHHDWELLEGRYTLAVLFEYAGTLGLIDLDYVDAAGARDDYVDNWGGDDLEALSRYDGLVAIRLTALGAHAVGLTDAYRPAAIGTRPLKVLPNLDVVAVGEVGAADRLVLSAYAERTADRVWAVSAGSLLSALDSGRDLDEFVAFLGERTDHELPAALRTVAEDVRRRSGQLVDLGLVRVIECADAATAALLGRDRAVCRVIGDRHIAVRPDQEPKFRKALLKLGYVMPSREVSG
ncbi:helicase-associated domain-containing protein [Saccharothrix coeruleofusca]|uniref:helicase-associated domain-containing protein n=1 Tax=Saccharothrix coeruleofusca TaxID=33919 RepID=UPI001E5F7B31|nr:helicase-associated domain-containing protein [Saccharothrix coeruleofusca]